MRNRSRRIPNAEADTIWWADQMNQKMRWPHFLTSRGWEGDSFGAKGYCLVDFDKKHFIFFVEDANSVTINLNDMPGSQPVILIDTKARYNEIDKGRMTASVHSIRLGPTSDWALAVGDFSVETSKHAVPDKPRSLGRVLAM